MIDRTSRWCMWLSSLHRHPNHMWSYCDRTSRWLIAPADDACDWVAVIVIRTICYLTEIAPADDWSHQQMMHGVAVIVIRTIRYLIEIAPADDWSHLQMIHVIEWPSSSAIIGLVLHTCLIMNSMVSLTTQFNNNSSTVSIKSPWELRSAPPDWCEWAGITTSLMIRLSQPWVMSIEENEVSSFVMTARSLE